MGLRAEEVVLSQNADGALGHLGKGDSTTTSVARRVRALRSILLADCLYGEVVKKDRIPKALGAKYGLENLFVVDLPSFWRLLYAIVRDRGTRYIVVVEIVDHRTYDRWLPGRGRWAGAGNRPLTPGMKDA